MKKQEQIIYTMGIREFADKLGIKGKPETVYVYSSDGTVEITMEREE